MKTKVFLGRFTLVSVLLIVGIALAFTACPSGGGGKKNNDPPLEGTVTITGTPQVGQTLTANTDALGGNGTIRYQWKRGDTAIAAGSNISGATSETYVLVAADEGKFIKVTVTRAGYNGSIDSTSVGPILAAGAPIPTVTLVEVNGPNVVTAGNSIQFSAVVTGTNSPAQTVNWTLQDGPYAAGTTISTSGLLTVAAAQGAATITVRATSTVDSSKYGQASASVIPSAPVVSSVRVEASNGSSNTTIVKGGTDTFTAIVSGLNAYSHDVTWTVTGNTSASTAITAAGVLTIAADETAASITVRATSVGDTTKSGTATVTIPATAVALTGSVRIEGNPQVTAQLTANTDNLQGSGTISYVWKRGATAEAITETISGATGRIYTLAAGDQGKFIAVTVARTGNTGNRTSAAVGPVAEAPTSVGEVEGTVTVENGIHNVNVAFTSEVKPTLSSGSGTITVTVSATGGGYQAYRWYVDGLELTSEKGSSLTISGANYTTAGDHRILVIAYRNGVPYSHAIPFTVQ